MFSPRAFRLVVRATLANDGQNLLPRCLAAFSPATPAAILDGACATSRPEWNDSKWCTVARQFPAVRSEKIVTPRALFGSQRFKIPPPSIHALEGLIEKVCAARDPPLPPAPSFLQ